MRNFICVEKRLISPVSIFVLFLILPLFGQCQVTEGEATEPSKKLIWQDEFNYNGHPDQSKWNYEVGFIRNNEPQYYTEKRLKNAKVEDGKLVITAYKEDYKGANYTSASINTKGKFHFTKGRIEVKAKLPKGKGVWPAIWTLGTNIGQVGWPECGEIDIMEYWGRNPNSVHANVHTGDYNHSIGKGRGGKITYEKPWEDFHVFAVEWYGDRLDFFLDDNQYYTCERKGEGIGEWPFIDPQYLLINLALTRGEDSIDDSIFPVEYLVDYVRIYSFE